MPNRDLHIGIDGDARGFDRATAEATAEARAFDRELARLERSQVAQEKVTARTTAAVERYAATQDKAGLAARKAGLEVKRAAEAAERAQARAAAAAEAYAKGLIDETKMLKVTERAEQLTERAAIKAAEAHLAEAEAARKASQDTEKHAESVNAVRGTFTSLIATAALVAPAVAGAGLAVIGFAAVAAPAITKVLSAQADLAGNWGTLDRRQKIAAVSVSSLISQYQDLAKSYEPDALAQFNGLVSTARGLLPELDKTVGQTKQGFVDFSQSLQGTVSREIPRLLDVLRGQATPALGELGTTFDQTAHLAVNLVQGLAPTGITLLHSANGALTLLNALTDLDPHLTEFAGAALAMRAPVSGLTNLWTKAAGGMRTLSAETKGASLAQKALMAVTKLGPGVFIAAAAGLAYLALRTSAVRDATDGMIDRLRGQYQAVGNNVRGYREYAAALKSQMDVLKQKIEAPHLPTETDYLAGQRVLAKQRYEYKKLKVAYDDANTAQKNVTQGAAELGKEFGVTSSRAIQLANAAGIDMSKGILKSGELTSEARGKIIQYQAAVAAAKDPTYAIGQALDAAGNDALLLKDRVTALQTAFNALTGPELASFDATTKAAQAFGELNKAMKASHGSMDLTTQKGQSAREAFGKLMTAVENSIDAQYQYDSVTKGAAAAEENRAKSAQKLLPLLLAETHGNEDAKQSVLNWANQAGVGKSRAEALAAALGTTQKQFLKLAHDAGVPRAAAEALWKEYQRLTDPLKLKVDDAEFLAKLHAAQGLRLDPKTGLLKGDNSDYFNKWLKAKGLRLDPKTGLFKGNNSDYYNKWLKANGLHIDAKTGVIRGNTAAFWASVASIPQVVATRTVAIHYAESTRKLTHADGGIDRYADGGVRHDLPPHIVTNRTVIYGEPETGGEAYIPLGLNKRADSVTLLSQVADMFGLGLVAKTPGLGLMPGASTATLTAATAPPATSTTMPPVSAASGNPLSLSDILSQWTDAVKPATKSDVNKAIKDRKSAVDRLKNAEDALYKARHARHRDARTIAADERRVAAARSNLADATKKLKDVEQRYSFAKMSPAQQLGAALGMSIKDNAAFIRNLQTLADRGFGQLAQQLLAMGGPEAQKLAASAVKLSSSKLSGLQKQIGQAQQQQDTLSHLNDILNVRSAIKNTRGGISTWTALLNATGLDPASLAAAVKLIAGDLGKTASGKALLADMHAHGYARGGRITGPPGIDQVPMWGTAGEYVVNARSTAAHLPLLEAINRSSVRVPTAAIPVRGGDGATAGATIHNTFQTQEMNVHQLSREASREIAWQLRG